MDKVSPTDRHEANKRGSRLPLAVLSALLLAALVTVVVLAVLLANAKSKSEPEALPAWPAPSTSPLGQYHKAAVAADNVLCSGIGRDVLMAGGNAVDAGVATLLCVGVMDAHSSGLGGGHFTTIYNATTRSCLVIDAREAAPLAATRDMYKANATLSQLGWTAIGVPGEVAGLYKAYQKGGSLAWSRLCQPTIDLLTNGYPVSEGLAYAAGLNEAKIRAEPTMSVWLNPSTNQPYRAGELMRRPVLAATLSKLAAARDPRGLFYEGDIAQSIVQEFQRNGALITLEDLRQYSAIERSVVKVSLGAGLTLCGPPPPSSAAVAASILKTFAGYPITQDNLTTVDGQVEVYHKFIEAMKFGYAERTRLGDSTFGSGNNTLASNITSDAFGEYIRSRITYNTHHPSYYGGEAAVEDHGTSHVSVLDAQGNAMSTTTTINFYFGSKRRSESTGIVWNDEMDDFSQPGRSNGFGFAPSASNFIHPQKRPMSSMSPVVIFNSTSGEVKLVTGAAGGSKIISTVAYVAAETLLFGQDIKKAIDAPRIHNQLYPTQTLYGKGFPAEYLAGLRARGHNLTLAGNGVVSSVATGVLRTPEGIQANSDWRKGVESAPAGY